MRGFGPSIRMLAIARRGGRGRAIATAPGQTLRPSHGLYLDLVDGTGVRGTRIPRPTSSRRRQRTRVPRTRVGLRVRKSRATGADICNLLENAERHATSTVTLAVQEHDSAVEVIVADDGAGIAPEDRQRMCERFTRHDDARTPHTSRSGLGLAIASEIVKQHSGTLTVEDTQPGARFVMRLPVTPATA